jgi:hypothetical protein
MIREATLCWQAQLEASTSLSTEPQLETGMLQALPQKANPQST